MTDDQREAMYEYLRQDEMRREAVVSPEAGAYWREQIAKMLRGQRFFRWQETPDGYPYREDAAAFVRGNKTRGGGE